jgi:hypothetical protein
LDESEGLGRGHRRGNFLRSTVSASYSACCATRLRLRFGSSGIAVDLVRCRSCACKAAADRAAMACGQRNIGRAARSIGHSNVVGVSGTMRGRRRHQTHFNEPEMVGCKLRNGCNCEGTGTAVPRFVARYYRSAMADVVDATGGPRQCAHDRLPCRFAFVASPGKYGRQLFCLRTGQVDLQLPSCVRQGKTLETAVMIIRLYRDKISLHKLAQWSVQRLFGNRKNLQQGVDGNIRIASDKVQNPVMDSSQPSIAENAVRTGGKGSVRKIEKLDRFAKVLVPLARQVNHVDMVRPYG